MARTLFRSPLRMQVEPPLKAGLEEAARRDETTVSEWARRALHSVVVLQGITIASPLPDRGERTDQVAA
jgi:hypothetical protein